jgi:putative ABC transport system permease protein
MRARETLHLSLRTLAANKRRSFLTMFGLIIGIGAVILVMSIGAGAQSLITGQIEKRGTNMIAIFPGSSDDSGPPAAAFGIVITTLTADDADALANKKNVSHVDQVAAYTSGNEILSWDGDDYSVSYTATTESYQRVESVNPALGRFFTIDEVDAGARVMVIGSNKAEEIFGNINPIGENVKLKRKQFKVIGVLEPHGASIFENPDEAVLIPLKTAQDDLLGIKHVSFIRMTVDDEKNLQQSVEQVKLTLTERHGEEDFSVRNTSDLLSILTTVTDAIRFFLVAIAAVSLFVGGVGIMNIMLISVKEKTKEVGLRKAVGATNKDILTQFLFETIVIAVVAGIIGIIGGALISFVISLVVNYLGYEYSFIISPLAIVVSVCVAGLIGIVFGVAPARKAASLNPIDALRYE